MSCRCSCKIFTPETKIRPHLVTIVLIAPFNPKLTLALHTVTYGNVHNNVSMTLRSRSPHHISLLFCYYPRLPHTLVSSDPSVLVLLLSDVSNEYSSCLLYLGVAFILPLFYVSITHCINSVFFVLFS